MRTTLVALACFATLGACQKRDPEFCGKHYPGDDTCGDAGMGSNTVMVSIGGTVSGLKQGTMTATGLVLQNNAGDDQPVAKDGTFVFATQLPQGASYDVTVSEPPTAPTEICTVTNGQGTAMTDVNDVQVTCELASYNVGGAVFGLNSGTSVTLGNSNGDSVNVTSNTNFTFPMKMVSGATFNVSVTGQPASGGPCVPFGGMGTVGNGDVTTIVVNCSSSGPYAIGGTVAGLNGTLVLKNTGTPTDMVSINSNGTYSFPMLVPSGNQYNVSVQTQPSYPPASQTCAVSNGGPFTANGNVQNVNVTCNTNSFTVGGMISGVTSPVTLQNNGGNAINQTADGSFVFSTPLLSGASYAVTAIPQNPALACNVMNGTGRVGNANVMSVTIMCGVNDPGIKCGNSYCSAGSQECCDPKGGKTCQATTKSCSHLYLPCDSAYDCPTQGDVCCADLDGPKSNVLDANCAAAASCTGSHQIALCGDASHLGVCPGTLTCSSLSILPGYYSCQ